MNKQRVRVALLASMVAVAAAFPVAQGSKAQAGECGSCSSAAPATVVTAPTMRTITVTEMVPEHYTTTRTVYKQQRFEEKYTSWKIERVPETRTRQVTVYEKVPVCEERTRCVCVSVPVCEQRTCMEKHWVCKQVTTYKRKCVDKGHYECKVVECKPGLFDRKNKCCDPCDPCCKPACVKTKTVKCWVPNKCYTEEPCTKTVKCCEYRPVTKTVKTCKKEMHTEKYTVNVCKCVPHVKTETYTCCVEKKTPIECTRTVCKCVPVTEQVNCCRMVKRCVEKQVPVCNPCETCKPCKRSWKKECCN